MLSEDLLKRVEDCDPESLVDLQLEGDGLCTVRTPEGWTLLHRAAQFGCEEIVLFLLSVGCGPNARDNKGYIPLHDAAMARNCSRIIIERLHSAGARIHAKNVYGETPLYCAVKYSNLEAVAVLLELGASRDMKTRRRMCPIDEARYQLDCLTGERYVSQREDLNRIIALLS